MKKIAIIPIGSHEMHGPHLPPETDYLIARSVAEEVSRQINVEISEGLKVGLSLEHEGFAETVSLTEKEFTKQVMQELNLYKDKDLRIIINAHGGNSEILRNLEIETKNYFILFEIFKIVKKFLNNVRTTPLGGICHAGEFETSLMLYLHPNLVKLQKVTPDQVKYVPELDPGFNGAHPKNWKTKDLNPHGILGDPLKASGKKGKIWFDLIVKEILHSIEYYLTIKII